MSVKQRIWKRGIRTLSSPTHRRTFAHPHSPPSHSHSLRKNFSLFAAQATRNKEIRTSLGKWLYHSEEPTLNRDTGTEVPRDKFVLLGYPRLRNIQATRLERFRKFLKLFAMFNELSASTQWAGQPQPTPQPQPRDPVSALSSALSTKTESYVLQYCDQV